MRGRGTARWPDRLVAAPLIVRPFRAVPPLSDHGPVRTEPVPDQRVSSRRTHSPKLSLMDCRTFHKHHLAYMDGTLASVERDAMGEHAGTCQPCATHDTRIRRSLMVARSLRPIAPSAGFAERLEHRLRDARAADPGRSARRSRGPGIGEFLAAAAAGVVAAGLMATAALERFRSHQVLGMPPVMASAPEPQAMPLTGPAFMASASPIVSVWPAALLLDQAPVYFANAELQVEPQR